MHPKTTPLSCSIIFPDDKLKSLDPVKWGQDNKGNGLKVKYIKCLMVKHIKFKLEKAGMFLDKDSADIGVSPYCIMYCKCH